jgi:beta-1,4-N-acetylglucosaminyltransferase
MKELFVTVGTTSFDALMSAMDSEDVLRVASKYGISHITLQVGRGEIPTQHEWVFEDTLGSAEVGGLAYGIRLSYFRYHSDLKAFVSKADFIVGHAGMSDDAVDMTVT